MKRAERTTRNGMTGIGHIVAVVVMFLLMTVSLGGSTEQPRGVDTPLESGAVQSGTAGPVAINVR